jgi:cytosine/adenosine deaminase-related metal-dependent hydrolase
MTRSAYTVIRGGLVLSSDASTTSHQDILIKGDTITELLAQNAPAPEGADLINAKERLLIPGLINTHAHGHNTLAKGMGGLWNLELQLAMSPWISGGREREDKYIAALLGAAEMIRKGCTTCYDLYLELPGPTIDGMQAVGQAYVDAGMRAVVAPMMSDRSFYEVVPGLLNALPHDLQLQVRSLQVNPSGQGLKVGRELLQHWPFDIDRVRPALAPSIPLHCSDEFLSAIVRMSREFNIGLHTHLAESRFQAEVSLTRFGQSIVAHMAKQDFLSSNLTVAHAIHITDEDRRLLAKHSVSVAHNPSANMRLGSGLADIRAMLDAGINIGIGTDGSVSSDNLNMFEMLRLTSFISRIKTSPPEAWLTATEILTMAGTNGARALGMQHLIGQIKAGYKADIVFLNLTNLNYVPLNDPVNQIVHCEDATGVDRVLIGGKIVFENGQLTQIDEAKLRERVEQTMQAVRARRDTVYPTVKRTADIVGLYCACLGGSTASHDTKLFT